MTEFRRTEPSERTFTARTSSIAEARQFVREATAGVTDAARVGDGREQDLRGDLELATSELVTNAVQYGLDAPIAVSVTVTPATVLLSVRSVRSSSVVPDPSTWEAPAPAMRTGRGLAIVKLITDDVAVDADDSTVTVHCTFRIG